jgi:hypothetical protein
MACELGWAFPCVILLVSRVGDKRLAMSKQQHSLLTTHHAPHRTRSRNVPNLLASLDNLLLLLSHISRIHTYTIRINTIPIPSHLHPSHPHTPPAQSSHIPTPATRPPFLTGQK